MADTTQVKWWAKAGKKVSGPWASRAEALREFKVENPKVTRGEVLSGYGSDGPWFSMQWSKANG